jgi:hypothetical protein
MGKLSIERVKELQREIAEIAAENHAYFACSKPDLPKKLLHKRRHERLEGIKEELAALLRRSAVRRERSAHTRALTLPPKLL